MKARAALLVAALLVLLPLPALAAIGVSPGEVKFEGLLRGGYYERYVTVSNPEDDETLVESGAQGDVAGWIVMEPQTFTLEGKGFKLVKVIVRPAVDAPNGHYGGSILFSSKPASSQQFQGTGAVAISSVSVTASVDVTDVELLQLDVDAMSVPDTEECRPILITVSVRNNGNVRATPLVHTDLYTPERRLLQSADQAGDAVLPTKSGVINMRLPFKTAEFACLPEGRYTADVAVTANGRPSGGGQVNFQIFPRGTLTLSGQLIEVTAPPNVTVGQVIRVDGVFKNAGQLPSQSKLALEVYSGGSLVATVNGEELEVLPGGIEKLSAFYTPAAPGRYRMSTYVTYEGRTTDHKDVEVDVLWPTSWLLGGAALLVIVLIALVLFARRRGRKKAAQQGKAKGRR